MRIYLLPIIISIGLSSCMTNNKKESHTGEISLQELKLNEIIHDSLTNRQIKDIERIQQVFAEVNSSTLEETMDNFKRDQNPDDEIKVWLQMASVYEQFTSDKVIDLNKKNEAYSLILLRSMMTEAEVMNKLTLKYLTENEAKEIFTYYTEQPKPLKIESK